MMPTSPLEHLWGGEGTFESIHESGGMRNYLVSQTTDICQHGGGYDYCCLPPKLKEPSVWRARVTLPMSASGREPGKGVGGGA